MIDPTPPITSIINPMTMSGENNRSGIGATYFGAFGVMKAATPANAQPTKLSAISAPAISKTATNTLVKTCGGRSVSLQISLIRKAVAFARDWVGWVDGEAILIGCFGLSHIVSSVHFGDNPAPTEKSKGGKGRSESEHFRPSLQRLWSSLSQFQAQRDSADLVGSSQ